MQHAKQYFDVAKCDLETLKQSSPGNLITYTYTMAYVCDVCCFTYVQQDLR